MRIRLPAALLLLLSSIFLVGGASSPASLTASVRAVAGAGQHSESRQVLPIPRLPRAHADLGPHSAFSGAAVLPSGVRQRPLTFLARAGAGQHDVPPAAGRAAAPARAPPSSTAF